jgi:hypothetical protein
MENNPSGTKIARQIYNITFGCAEAFDLTYRKSGFCSSLAVGVMNFRQPNFSSPDVLWVTEAIVLPIELDPKNLKYKRNGGQQ